MPRTQLIQGGSGCPRCSCGPRPSSVLPSAVIGVRAGTRARRPRQAVGRIYRVVRRAGDGVLLAQAVAHRVEAVALGLPVPVVHVRQSGSGVVPARTLRPTSRTSPSASSGSGCCVPSVVQRRRPVPVYCVSALAAPRRYPSDVPQTGRRWNGVVVEVPVRSRLTSTGSPARCPRGPVQLVVCCTSQVVR